MGHRSSVVEETSPRSYVVQTPDGIISSKLQRHHLYPEKETLLKSRVFQGEEIPTSVETEDNTPS